MQFHGRCRISSGDYTQFQRQLPTLPTAFFPFFLVILVFLHHPSSSSKQEQMSDRDATRMPSDAVSDKTVSGILLIIHSCSANAILQKPPALSAMLNDGDIVLLLRPAIVPEASPLNRGSNYPPSDPFEPLGKALARYHPWVRHVPYVPRNGITSTHETHVALAAAVIFVISGPPCHGQPSQVTPAERVRALCEGRPQVILTCCDARELGPLGTPFPTPIKVLSLDPLHLEAAAACILFGERRNSSLRRPGEHYLIPLRQPWAVEAWDGNSDASAVFDLWRRCLPKKFHLGRDKFETLLCRDGYQNAGDIGWRATG